MTDARRRVLLSQLVRFFVATLLGLSIDFGTYALLTWFGTLPVVANIVSSSLAVVFLFTFSTRHVFGSDRTLAGFTFFATWYVLSILLFSAVVQIIFDQTALSAIWSKVATLPFSFLANFFGSRWALRLGDRVSRRRRPEPEDPDARPT